MGACVGKKEQQDQTLLENAHAENQPQLKWDNRGSDHNAKQSSRISSRLNQDRSMLTRPEQVLQQSRQQERVEANQLQSVVQQFRSAPQPPLQSYQRQTKYQLRNPQTSPQQPISEQQHLDFVNRVNPLNIAIVVS